MLISNIRPQTDDFYKSAKEIHQTNNKDHTELKVGIVGGGKLALHALVDTLMSDEALNGDELKINI